MNPAIRTMAKANEENRFLIRYWLPLKKITLEPVTDISCLSLGNIVSIFLYRESSLAYIFLVPISFTRKFILTFCMVESTKELAIAFIPPVDSMTYFIMKFLVMLLGSL